MQASKTAGVPSLVADGVAFAALIVGQAVDLAKVDQIVDGITVTLDGQEMARGLEGDDGLDPLTMVGVLMAHARELSNGSQSRPRIGVQS